MTDARTIARGLTRAQRKAIKTAEFHGQTGQWRCLNVMHPADRNLRTKGLATGLWVALTPLGLAVRQALLEQSQ